MSRSPEAISITPAKVTLKPGQVSAQCPVQVLNSGTEPLSVTAKPMTVLAARSSCGTTVAPNWVTVTPAKFTLKPGQAEKATLVIRAPAGTHTDIAAMFTVAGKASPGHAALGGTVGSQVVIGGGPGACSHAKASAPLPSHHSGQVPALAVFVGLIVFAALLTTILAAVVRRGRHRAA